MHRVGNGCLCQNVIEAKTKIKHQADLEALMTPEPETGGAGIQ